MELRKSVLGLLFFLILFIGLFLGSMSSYGKGFHDGATWAIKLGLEFTEIDVDVDELLAGIFQYENNIQGCYFTKRGLETIEDGL